MPATLRIFHCKSEYIRINSIDLQREKLFLNYVYTINTVILRIRERSVFLIPDIYIVSYTAVGEQDLVFRVKLQLKLSLI